MRFIGLSFCVIGITTFAWVGNAAGQDEVLAEIQKTSVPPTIDGMGDDAVWAAATERSYDDFFTVSGAEPDDEEDLSVTWKALWDDENLYVLVNVRDDQIINDEECNWDDDGIEVYIDAQNIDSIDYRPNANDLPPDGAPAYQFTAIAGDRTACDKYSDDVDEHPSPFGWGINSYHDVDEDDEITQYPQESDTGTSLILDENNYTLEVAFPWEAIEDTPANIQSRELGMGFDVVVNDDDDEFGDGFGGGRDSQVAWETTANNFWNNSEVFPQVQLSDELVGGDPCDYDGDGSLGAGDLNILSAAIAGGDMDAKFDVNADGAVDVADLNFFATDETKLFSWIGDANVDKEFNSGDLVAVFAAGKYETGAAATWEEGDWNADLKFDSGDLVAAFAGGGYEQGPRGAAAAVPEPNAMGLVLLGLLSTAALRRRRS